jgi:hypothetical protein
MYQRAVSRSKYTQKLPANQSIVIHFGCGVKNLAKTLPQLIPSIVIVTPLNKRESAINTMVHSVIAFLNPGVSSHFIKLTAPLNNCAN